MINSSFDPTLVTLSFVIAFLASFTALELARRVANTAGSASKVWLAAGAMSMGLGIWSMHFVGMLAFSMDMPFSYDVPLTAFSLLIGVAASAFAIHVGSLKSVSNRNIGISGLILGAGIAAMHYSGMAAMKMDAVIHYDPLLVGLSLFVAIIAATAAIWIALKLANAADAGLFWLKAVAAAIMGVAICGMHYIGMIAATYTPIAGAQMGVEDPLANTYMAISLGIATIVVLGITHLSIFFDYKLAAHKKISRHAESEAIQLSEILDESANEIYVFEEQSLLFLKANKGALQNLGYSRRQLEAMTPVDLKPAFTVESFRAKIQPLCDGSTQRLVFESVHRRSDGSTYPVSIHLQLSNTTHSRVFVAVVDDITERKQLEAQIMQSSKLESIGQLAAGIAHEINTPTQFVGDNVRFLQDSFDELLTLIESYRTLERPGDDGAVSADRLKAARHAVDSSDLAYLKQEIPSAIHQSLDGISRISKIVMAMKEFSHPGDKDKELVDLNKIIANTITVASNEWKYIAELKPQLDESLPFVQCHPQAISQVMLNLIVNAAHAITEKNGENSAVKGEITVSTCVHGSEVLIRVKDSGCGVPPEIRDRVFDPFFTTKGVGRGTGQGLAMAYSTVVDKHGGTIRLESELGTGSTFVISLPMQVMHAEPEEVAG